METKLTLVIAVLALFGASVDAQASKIDCVPLKSVVGQVMTCTCSGSAPGTAATAWTFDREPGAAGNIKGDATTKDKYEMTVAIRYNSKKVGCQWTHANGKDTVIYATLVVEDPAKPTLKCDPAKVVKDKESTCTCATTNTVTPSKFTFSVDAAAAVDGTGTTKNELKVKVTKETKATCMAYFDTIKSDASAEFTIGLDAGTGSGTGSGSGTPGLPLAAMLFAFIATLFLRV